MPRRSLSAVHTLTVLHMLHVECLGMGANTPEIRSSAGHARHADPQGGRARPDARLRDRAAPPADVAAMCFRSSRAPSTQRCIGSRSAAGCKCGVGGVRYRPGGEVLLTHEARPESSSRNRRRTGTASRRRHHRHPPDGRPMHLEAGAGGRGDHHDSAFDRWSLRACCVPHVSLVAVRTVRHSPGSGRARPATGVKVRARCRRSKGQQLVGHLHSSAQQTVDDRRTARSTDKAFTCKVGARRANPRRSPASWSVEQVKLTVEGVSDPVMLNRAK